MGACGAWGGPQKAGCQTPSALQDSEGYGEKGRVKASDRGATRAHF